MAAYNTGAVDVTVGSSTVTGSGTRFDLYVSVGDLFHLTGKPLYEIAAVTSSQGLTLTTRYSDTDYQTSVASEAIASTTDASLAYYGTLSGTPVIRSSVVVDASDVTWADNGAGVLATTSGAGVGAAGTIDYDSGTWVLNYNSTPTASLNITASYYVGDELSSMGYQIISDFTTYYSIPEMSVNDKDYPRIFTKAVRVIDAALVNASILTATIRTGYAATFITNNLDATTADIYTLHSSTFTVNSVDATSGDIATLHSATLTASDFTATTLEIYTLHSDTLSASNLTATTGDISTLRSDTLTASNLTATTGEIPTLHSDTLTASNVDATTGDISTLHSATFTSNSVDATTLEIYTLHAETLTASDLTATTGDIVTLHSQTLTASDFTATTAEIYTAHSQTLTASDLTATTGEIPTLHSESFTASLVTATVAKSTRYFQCGDHQYIFFGSEPTEASVVAVATAVDASVKGSIYMSRAGVLWVFDDDATATLVSLT